MFKNSRVSEKKAEPCYVCLGEVTIFPPKIKGESYSIHCNDCSFRMDVQEYEASESGVMIWNRHVKGREQYREDAKSSLLYVPLWDYCIEVRKKERAIRADRVFKDLKENFFKQKGFDINARVLYRDKESKTLETINVLLLMAKLLSNIDIMNKVLSFYKGKFKRLDFNKKDIFYTIEKRFTEQNNFLQNAVPFILYFEDLKIFDIMIDKSKEQREESMDKALKLLRVLASKTPTNNEDFLILIAQKISDIKEKRKIHVIDYLEEHIYLARKGARRANVSFGNRLESVTEEILALLEKERKIPARISIH